MHLEVFSRKWGRKDHYHIRRTETGWEIINAAIDGVCDKTGSPALFQCLKHDHVRYPANLGEQLEELWEDAEVKKMTNREIQKRLDLLSDLIQIMDENAAQGASG